MVNPQAYIKKVNRAVRKGTHDRRIRIIKQEYTPSSAGHHGMALTYKWKGGDEIRIPKGLPKNRVEARKLEKTERGRMIKKTYGLKRIPTEKEVLRHELWHIAKPHAKESTIKKYDDYPLPNKLPDKRKKGFDKHR